MTQTQLENELKTLIISALDLEDITPADIDTNAPLFGDGLGLDSIDALELGMAIKKKYGVSFEAGNADNKKHFQSLSSLAAYIAAKKGM